MADTGDAGVRHNSPRLLVGLQREAKMRAYLSPYVYAADCGDAVVFLDVAADTYVIASSEDVQLSGRRTATIASAEALQDLSRAGLIGLAPTTEALPSKPPPRLGFAAAFERGPVRAGDVAAFSLAAAMTQASFGRSSLAQLLRFSAARSPRAGSRPTDAFGEIVENVHRLACVYQTLMIWSPWQGRCLYRSFLLQRFLRARGCDAQWVFGVRTWPFLAHCWIQAGDQVLADDPQRLRAFRPLFAI